MPQDVLAVAVAELETTQEPYEIGMQSVDSCVKDGLLTFFPNHHVHLSLRPFHPILDPRRMNPTVRHEFGKGKAGYLPSHRIKAGKGHAIGSVINDNVHTGGVLQRPDVSAFPTDDTAFHIVAGYGHHRDRDL